MRHRHPFFFFLKLQSNSNVYISLNNTAINFYSISPVRYLEMRWLLKMIRLVTQKDYQVSISSLLLFFKISFLRKFSPFFYIIIYPTSRSRWCLYSFPSESSSQQLDLVTSGQLCSMKSIWVSLGTVRLASFLESWKIRMWNWNDFRNQWVVLNLFTDKEMKAAAI